MGTADGIEDNDWEHVKELAARLCDAAEGSEQETISFSELFEYLDELENKYGPLPSILATRGDFVDDYEKKESLLSRAYAAAVAIGDRKNALYIAHSMTALYMDELVSLEEARQWLDRLDRHLLDIHDSTYADDAQKFRRRLKELEGK